jgi:hypothetical protein
MLVIVAACKQEVITPGPEVVVTPSTGDPGNVTWTKFVAVGNSYVAGVQGGALFNDGQANSMAAIVSKQLVSVGAPAIFNQPDIGATLGWNLFVTQAILGPPSFDPTKPVLGKMLLQYNGATSPKPTPQAYDVGNFEAVPNPSVNPPFMYAGVKADLNNFGVAAITLGQSMTGAAGNWGVPNPAVGFTPFYARFATIPNGTSSFWGRSHQGTTHSRSYLYSTIQCGLVYAKHTHRHSDRQSKQQNRDRQLPRHF